MSKRRSEPFIDGNWKRLPKRWLHGCCDCRSTHWVDMKMVGGRFYLRWIKSPAQTKYWREQGY